MRNLILALLCVVLSSSSAAGYVTTLNKRQPSGWPVITGGCSEQSVTHDKDGVIYFRFCSQDNDVPGKKQVKTFEVYIISALPPILNELTLESANTGNRLEFDFTKRKIARMETKRFITLYSLESPEVITKIISKKIPIIAEINVGDVKYRFNITDPDLLNEMKMIADLN